MKALLIAESRQGKLLPGSYETLAFANQLGAEMAMFLVSSEDALPQFDGTLYWADVAEAGEYNPEEHVRLLLEVVAKENPQLIVCHTPLTVGIWRRVWPWRCRRVRYQK